jgi:NTP pyrophosphatase (non-canonical NTP hydrolase)
MKPNKYLKESERTERKFPDGLSLEPFQIELLHASMGAVTESAEMMDAMKKHLIYGAELDMVNVLEEIGDMMWYIAIVCRVAEVSLGTVLQNNIDKLRVRFPDQFDELQAMDRDLDAERTTLENIG